MTFNSEAFESYSFPKKCNICKRLMDQGPDSTDCGGDCLRCMAECGDLDCMKIMHELEPNEQKWMDE